jgi:beta-lactamase class A
MVRAVPGGGMIDRRRLLTGALALAALPAVASGADSSWDVQYGTAASESGLLLARRTVERILGPGVARKLRVVEAPGGAALVYSRGGTESSSRRVAGAHARLLSPHGLSATAVERGAVSARPAEDAGLEAAVESYVKGARLRGEVARDEHTSWLVHDVEANRSLVTINADMPRQAASMIKPLVMLAFFSDVDRGRFIYGPVSRSKLTAMIQRSDNTSTNWVIDQIGGPRAVHARLHERFGRLVPHTRVVERIGAGGVTYRNAASASDYGRYLTALWNGELPHSLEQLRLLRLPGNDRIYNGVPSIPTGTFVYNKTGTTSRLIGDMGLLAAVRRSGGKRLPYVLVGIVEKDGRASSLGQFSRTRGDVIRGVSDRAYTHLKAMYDLA